MAFKVGGGGRAPFTGRSTSLWPRRRHFFLRIQNGQFFTPNIWQMMIFLNPLDGLIPKIPFSFFLPIFGSGSPLRQAVSSVGFWGSRRLSFFFQKGGAGGASQGALSTPAPLRLKAHLPLVL